MPKKKEKPKQKKAAHSAEDAERQALTKQIIGDLPYERTLYINEARRFLKRSIEDILTVGKLFLIIQEKEGYGDFRKIVENEIGIPHTTAYRFMNAAMKAEKHPAINLSQLGQVSKVYALLEAPEEELKKFEQLGLFAGKNADELMDMSHKELRELVHDLKDNKEKYVAKETRILKTDNDSMKEMLKEFEELVPDHKGKPKMDHALALAEGFYRKFEGAMDYIRCEALDLNDGGGMAAMESLMQKMYSRITHKMEELQKYKRGEGLS